MTEDCAVSVCTLTYEDDGGEERLLVVVDAPLALQSQGEDGEDHHLHAVRHPAKADHEAEHDLEPAEADAVDGLGHRERVVRHNSAGSRCNRSASLGLLILEQEQQSKSTVAFARILIQCAKLFHNALRIDCAYCVAYI